MIAPDDVELITGNSETRRKFVDTLLSQIDNNYLSFLIEYNKVLLQRNSFLKHCSEKGQIDEALLEILNEQLIKPGTAIFNRRKSFLDDFLPLVELSYNKIAGTTEPVKLSYFTPLANGEFKELLQANRQKDFLLQRTTVGIHKDDIEVNLNSEAFRNTASQGQRKSLLFAFKLAEFEELKEAKGFPPILLLDDVFEKLDATRMQNLLYRVCVENKGQVFITDTHKERLRAALESLNVEYQLIELNEQP
jgi:DNA replication and repair protein RecF